MPGFWEGLFGGDKKNTAPAAPVGTGSARVAAERLKVIVATDNQLSRRLTPESVERMKQEIMEVVNRYVRGGVSKDHVRMSVRTEANMEMLEMNINLPDDQ